MPDERLNSQPQEGENVEREGNTGQNDQQDQDTSGERFLSDTQKIVRRHLENKHDVITDEDIRNVRVGMTPPVLDEATQARFGDEEEKDQAEEDYLGPEEEEPDPEANKNDKITPWDAIDPSR